MQRNIKKMIIALLIILIVLAGIVIFAILGLRKNSDSQISDDDEERTNFFDTLENNPSEIINGEKMLEVKSENMYFTIDKIINIYYKYLKESNSNAIYNILYKEYINSNNLNEQNILSKLTSYEEYEINEMYALGTTVYEIYYVKISNNGTSETLLINLDRNNNTFSICPISEEKYNEGIQKGLEVNAQRISSIESNDFNKITYQNLDKDNIARAYFQDFIKKIVNTPEEAYKILDNDYKKINFQEYSDFKEYINNNNQRFEGLDRSNVKEPSDFSSNEEYEQYITEKTKYYMQEYSKQYKDDVTIYTFKDSLGKYYIFEVTSAMRYTVTLDTYTLPTDDFIETYNNSTNSEKIVLNIKRFFMGIDDKNYGYSYSVLSKSFRDNKYPTKQEFIQYVQSYFFEKNEIEYIELTKEQNLYVYKIKITDASGSNSESRVLNIIMKLNDGTDFEMSFGTN